MLATATFLLAPIVVVTASAFTASDYVVFPPAGFSLKWLAAATANDEFRSSFFASVGLALVNAVLAPLIGSCAALAIARFDFPGRNVIATFLLSPLMLPAIVLGVALLQFLAIVGLLGTYIGVTIGHLLLTVPYSVRLIAVSLGGFDWDLERAARILGATKLQAYRLVVVPLTLPGLAAAAAFSFILSFDEVTISLFTTGADVTTLPVVIFKWVEYNYDPIVAAASAITVLMAATSVIVIDRTVGLGRVFGQAV